MNSNARLNSLNTSFSSGAKRNHLFALAFLAGWAATPIVGFAGGLNVDLGGLGGVTVGGGGGLVDADLDVAGIDVEADVLSGDTVAGVCVGSCGGAGSGPGTGVPKPGVPGVVAENGTRKPLAPGAAMRCAKAGNTDVYNGFTLVDRDGDFLGWVHATSLDTNFRIAEIRVQLEDSSCIGLKGGSYRVSGTQMTVNMDGSTLR